MFEMSKAIGIEALRSDAVVNSASFLKSGPSSTLYPLTEAQGARLSNSFGDGILSSRKSGAIYITQSLRSPTSI